MKFKFRIDLWLLAPVLILVILSLTTLFSINMVYFRAQLLSLLIGLVGFFIFSQLDINSLKLLKLPIYIISIILLGIILLIGIKTRGAIRWIDIAGVKLQFSEILKPFLAVSFSTFLSEQSYPARKSFFFTLALFLPVFLLIYLQPDLGNALIYAFVTIIVLVVSGFPILWFFLALIPILLALPLLWSRLHEYQRQRFLIFLHPKLDPLGTSYNSIQAVITVGAGSLFGRGLSEGTQSALHFLPERQTDFIFATLAEGLGFIGASIVVVAFFLLCIRIFILFKNSEDRFSRIFITAGFAFFFVQFFVNIGMNLGYLPIVGVTLPFVSFGGSSLLASFIFLGILSSLSVSNRHKRVLEIR